MIAADDEPLRLTVQISQRLSGELRKAKGSGSWDALRQRMLEKGAVVREQELSRWESGPKKGHAIPDLDRLPQIAQALGVPLSWLLLGSEDEAADRTTPPKQQGTAPPPTETAPARERASLETEKTGRAHPKAAGKPRRKIRREKRPA